jgi:23S rRNA pseudouridine1911/1915/1917 synthase
MDDRLFRPLRVPEAAAGRRVDQFLADRFPGMSRTAAARYIADGRIRSAARGTLKASSLVHAGEQLHIFVDGYAPDAPEPPLPPVLYEDEQVLVIDKPAGMLVHPAGEKWAWALIGIAKRARPAHRVDLVHRLDRDTSGVLVLTKDLAANVLLKEIFRERDAALEKEYLAVVRGEPAQDAWEVDAPMGDHPSSAVRLRKGLRPDGAPARTGFRVLERRPGRALVACRLYTGRTHQIRVHLEASGHPLFGDKLYGHPDEVFIEWLEHGATPRVQAAAGHPRQCLHAWRMALPLPGRAPLQLEAPLPEELRAVLEGIPFVWPAAAPAAGDEGGE